MKMRKHLHGSEAFDHRPAVPPRNDQPNGEVIPMNQVMECIVYQTIPQLSNL
jgi:hypothetical protein